MKTPIILVVDDEPDNFDVIEALLPSHDYLFFYTASGEETLQNIDSIKPDVILLDVMMPGLDGIEVCQRLKASDQWRAIPIIMVTALNSKEDLAHCLKAGADDFISKPVNSVELRARLHSMLRIKQQYEQLQTLNELQENTIDLLKRNLETLRGELAKTLPHELNTPLNGIIAMLDLVLSNLDNMSISEIRELLNLCHKSTLRLEATNQRFLRYISVLLTE